MEHVEDDMQPMKISPFAGPRYFILNGCDECLCIGNHNPFHWEHLLCLFAPSIPHCLGMRNYLRRYI